MTSKNFIHVLAFLCLFFASSPAFSEAHLKLVFPFGENPIVTVCPTQYSTSDGCCRPPDSVYQYSIGIDGCCRSTNEIHTIGGTTRCCLPEGAGQSRWNQTATSPCGQFCTQPSLIINSFGQSSCCAPLNPGQNRWGQTATSLCGGYCPTPNVISTYNGFSSCCSNCADVGGVLAFQTNTSVCGTCCSQIPISCGNIGERVCEPGTGSTYCSQNSACNHPHEWSYGTPGEGGYTCCTSCTGTRYGHGTSSCGNCCLAPNITLNYSGGPIDCCAAPTISQTRFSQTMTSPCGQFCTLPNVIASFNTSSSCCPDCVGTRWKQTTTSVCGTCCATGTTHELLTVDTKTDCCLKATVSQTRWNQTNTSPCGELCTQPSTILTFGTAKACCPACSTARINQSETNVCGTCISCGTGGKFDVATKTCSCDEDAGYMGTWHEDTGSGNGCTYLNCDGRVLAKADLDPAKTTVKGITVTYRGALTLTQSLNLGQCNLVVTGGGTPDLLMNDGISLTCNTLTVKNGNGTIHMGSSATINVTTVYNYAFYGIGAARGNLNAKFIFGCVMNFMNVGGGASMNCG